MSVSRFVLAGRYSGLHGDLMVPCSNLIRKYSSWHVRFLEPLLLGLKDLVSGLTFEVTRACVSQGLGHVAHCWCGPLWHTAWHMCRHWTHGNVPRGEVPGLGLINEVVNLLRGDECDILAQGLIGLIEYSYQQVATSFPEAHSKELRG